MEIEATAIIPAYNEESYIGDTIDALNSIPHITEIIVINDGSVDKTSTIARQKGVHCIDLKTNKGKGKALGLGVSHSSKELVVFVDADLGYSANKMQELISPVANNKADMSIAKFTQYYRKLSAGGFGLVNRLAKYGTYYLTGQKIISTLSGQRVITREVAKKIVTPDVSSGYGVELGMTVEALRLGYKIVEVELNMSHRQTGKDLKGFIHRGRQFFDILATIMRKVAVRQ